MGVGCGIVVTTNQLHEPYRKRTYHQRLPLPMSETFGIGWGLVGPLLGSRPTVVYHDDWDILIIKLNEHLTIKIWNKQSHWANPACLCHFTLRCTYTSPKTTNSWSHTLEICVWNGSTMNKGDAIHHSLPRLRTSYSILVVFGVLANHSSAVHIPTYNSVEALLDMQFD